MAGVAKNTAINWEKDASSPTATALIAWAEAGADALYILTGKRTADRPHDVGAIEDYLATTRRDMLLQEWEAAPGESETEAEDRAMALRAELLRDLLQRDAVRVRPELAEEIESLLQIVTSPAQLALFRAADHAQRRAKRRRLREALLAYTDLGDLHPTEAAINVMTTIALEYGVPVQLLMELFFEVAVLTDDGDGQDESTTGAR